MKKILFRLILSLIVPVALLAGLSACSSDKGPTKVLVFSKTAGFRHESILSGIEAIRKLGQQHNFEVDTTENAERFNEENLRNYKAVIFLNTTGDVLDKQQQNDFERFIQAGGGYVGIHAATDTEYDWPWYGKLAGAYFQSHPGNPNVRTATFNVIDKNHISTDSLPDSFEKTDEFYNFKNINPDVTTLITIDENTYEDGENGEFHPMSWYHNFDGGRAFYTAMGHTNETFSEPLFVKHLTGGILYAIGRGDGGSKVAQLDYKQVSTPRVPDENRFTKVVLAEKLNEPMELAVMTGGKVLFIERLGKLRLYDPASQQIKDIATIDVSHVYNKQDGNQPEAEDGLLGLALDPNYETNHWIYLYYSPAGSEPKNILTRYEFWNDELKLDTKKVLLEVAVQRDECCHTGGSIAFDAQGNLYLSTGDNTSPRATAYAPIDDRPGRNPWDARKGSANTNDLRGKVLRIHPEADGTYTIPEGNLFAPGTEKTRPEIYAMGTRNPFRISVDQKTGYLYWGDVGPDAGKDSTGLGPRAYDEINQARKAGFFGWPLFTGNDQAYHDYDFATGVAGPRFDPKKPVNDSKNNTGLTELPPTAPSFIWYPYDRSEEFPLMGTGGRTAMAGPVYYSEDFKGAPGAFPDYYNRKLFIYEWMRGWIIAVSMDEEGNYVDMERFMPNYRFSNPMDMEFGPEGDLYVLEYGSGWFVPNDDARLVKIEYNGGNRKPQVRLAVDKPKGATPLTVSFDTKGTKDFDRDDISFDWKVNSSTEGVVATSKEANPTFTLEKSGVYNVVLTVSDSKGEKTIEQREIVAGNEPPQLSFNITRGNSSFFFANQAFDYEVKVEDKEDGNLESGGIAADEVAVTIDYLPEGFDQVEIAQGHLMADASVAFATGKKLMAGSDCAACHQVETKSIGPNFKEIAAKYKDDSKAVDYLADKVINGGSGVWGGVAMAAHPQLSKDDASTIVKYILSLGNEQAAKPMLPIAGSYTTKIDKDTPKDGVVMIRAVYTDKGANEVPSVTAQEMLVLKSPNLVPAAADEMDGIQVFKMNPSTALAIVQKSDAFTKFNNIDLTDIGAVMCIATVPVDMLNASGGVIEVRMDGVDGELLGQSDYLTPVEGPIMRVQPKMPVINLKATSGKHDIYFVYKSDKAAPGQGLMVHLAVSFLPAGASAGGAVSLR